MLLRPDFSRPIHKLCGQILPGFNVGSTHHGPARFIPHNRKTAVQD